MCGFLRKIWVKTGKKPQANCRPARTLDTDCSKISRKDVRKFLCESILGSIKKIGLQQRHIFSSILIKLIQFTPVDKGGIGQMPEVIGCIKRGLFFQFHAYMLKQIGNKFRTMHLFLSGPADVQKGGEKPQKIIRITGAERLEVVDIFQKLLLFLWCNGYGINFAGNVMKQPECPGTDHFTIKGCRQGIAGIVPGKAVQLIQRQIDCHRGVIIRLAGKQLDTSGYFCSGLTEYNVKISLQSVPSWCKFRKNFRFLKIIIT